MAEEKKEDVDLEEADESREDLQKLLDEKLEELEKTEDQLLRLRADFSNFKRRTEESKSDMIAFALESFIKDMLPIIDDFERALEAPENKEEAFYEGVELIYGQLEKLLGDNKVEEIDALGEEFDPNLHHAVFMEEVEGSDSNKVVEVFQKGYRMNEKVIRPAMVKVSK